MKVVTLQGEAYEVDSYHWCGRERGLNLMDNAIRSWMQSAGQETPATPTLADDKVQALRVRLIQEELDELKDAYENCDIVAVADAIADLLYVVHGTAVAHGIDMAPIFIAVHENNEDKIARGHRDAGGKWIKPANHQPPDLKTLIDQQLMKGNR